MQRRPTKLLWLLLAVLFAGQSLLPVAALADVSIRCAGVPAAAAPCARGTFMATDTAAIAQRFSGLACCRKMTGCTMTAPRGCRTMAAVTPTFSQSAPPCLLTVTLLNTRSAALSPQAHRWLLLSAPALAPPAARTASRVLTAPVTVALPTLHVSLPPSVSTHSHGLRAPPCA